MKNTLVVVADLGGFKVYKLTGDDPLAPSPRLELIEEFANREAHDHIVDNVTDLSGRFPRRTGPGAGGGAMSDGERHNLQLERRRRFIRTMAQRLNRLAANGNADQLMLAASREINHQLIEELDPQVRTKILKSVAADLTKLGRAEILRHF